MKDLQSRKLRLFYLKKQGVSFLAMSLIFFACDPSDPGNTPAAYPLNFTLQEVDPSIPQYYVFKVSGLEPVVPSSAFEEHVAEWLEFLADPSTLELEFLRSLRFSSDSDVETVWFDPISGDSAILSASYTDSESFLTLSIDNEQIELIRNENFTEIRWCEQMFMNTTIAPGTTDVVLYKGPQSQPCYQFSNFNLSAFVDDGAAVGDTIAYVPYELVYKLED